MPRPTAARVAAIKDPTARAVAEFTAASGSYEDRIGHQSVWKFKDDGTVQPGYADHVRQCGVCADLDAGGDGLGGSR